MALTRIAPTRAVPVSDHNLDRVQKALLSTVDAIANKPLVDSQVIRASTVATTADQIVTVAHNLSRTPVGMILAASSILLTQVGKHIFTATTASVTITQSASTSGALTFVVF